MAVNIRKLKIIRNNTQKGDGQRLLKRNKNEYFGYVLFE